MEYHGTSKVAHIGNEIEPGIWIRTIESRIVQVSRNKGNRTWCLRFNDKRSSGMHRDQHGHPGPSVDHSSERCLGDVWRISRTVE